MIDVLRQNRLFVAGFLALVLVVILMALISGDDDEGLQPEAVDTTTTTGPQPTTTVVQSGVDRPEIPQVACGLIREIDDIEIALGSEDRPFSELDSFMFSQGEVCHEELASDPAYYVLVEPGTPEDFLPDATINGVNGEEVDGVGSSAKWFGGADTEDSGVSSTIVVFEETLVGELFFRITLGRPDATPAEHREILTELALVILPRFPYMQPDRPDPIPIELEVSEAPGEPRPLEIDEVVLAASEEQGWTEGQAILAGLRALSGEDTELVLPEEADLLSGSATGLMLMAINYIDTGPDASLRTEIEAIIAERRRFGEIGAITSQPEVTPLAGANGSPTASRAKPAFSVTRTVAGQDLLAQADTDDDALPASCSEDPWAISCLKTEDLGGIRLHYPAALVSGPIADWTMDDVDSIRSAIQTVIAEYTQYGSITRTDVGLTPEEGPLGEGIPNKSDFGCVISLRSKVASLSPERQDFFLAMEIAGCFLYENLPKEVFQSYSASKWWYQGMIGYLAAEAFPASNIEFTGGPVQWLHMEELANSLQDRSIHNFPFFRSYGNHWGGPGAALALVAGQTNAPSKAAQQAKLAANSASKPALHVFHEELSDGVIMDQTGPMQYQPVVNATVEIADDMTIFPEAMIPFGAIRAEFVVPPGKIACLEYEASDEVLVSWREGSVGGGGGASWAFDTPSELTGDSLFVFTTTFPDQTFEISAEVYEGSECEEEEEPGDIGEFELPDCGLCDPSWFYRAFGALKEAIDDAVGN